MKSPETVPVSTKAQHQKRYRPVPGLLKQLRDDAGLTQRALADRLGVPQSWVYKCEAAIRRVDVAEFADWARACGVEPAEAIQELCGGGASRGKKRRGG